MTDYEITNTSTDSLHAAVQRVAGAVLPGLIMPAGAIEAQEAAGQRELLVAAAGDWTRLPSEMHGVSRDELQVLGFEFGVTVPGDDLFVNVRLPIGWYVDGTTHSLHKTLRDAAGFGRAKIVYKVAYYDRRAGLSLVSVPLTEAQYATQFAIKNALGDTWRYPIQGVEDDSRAVRFTYHEHHNYQPTGKVLHVVIEPDGSERSRAVVEAQ